MTAEEAMQDLVRCGKDKRHTPHWHGPGDTLWCDGKRPYRPTPRSHVNGVGVR